MDAKTPELAIYEEHGSCLVAGDPNAIAELFRKLDVQESSTASLGVGMIELLAGAAGLVAGAGQYAKPAGNAFQMTAESYARYLELFGATKDKAGVVSGLARTANGRIDKVLEFTKASPIHPAAAANLPVLAANVAIRTAIRKLEQLVESVDEKLDVLLRDNRDETLGNIQGSTHILDKAYGYFEETGGLNGTMWDQIAGLGVELEQARAVALTHIDCLADGLVEKNFGKRLSNAKKAAEGELQHWLIITAVALSNMARFDSLETVHAATADGDMDTHERHVAKAKLKRLDATTAKLQKLADSAAKATDVGALTRVANPLDMPQLYTAVERIQRLLALFAETYGMPEMATVTRTTWNESVWSLGQQAGQGVAGMVSAAAEGVAAVPKAIGGGVEDKILKVARSIESRRLAPGVDKGEALKETPDENADKSL